MPISNPPVAISIAGSDSSAGAGLQADLKTFQHFQLYGLTATTCVVAETPNLVRSVHPLPPDFLADQLEVLFDGFPIAAAKTGMLFSTAHIEVTARLLSRHPQLPLVVDPVMIASTGDPLIEPDAVDAYRTLLLPRATLITPNLDEAAHLLGYPIQDETKMPAAALELSSRFQTAVLLKGGHLKTPTCTDLLASDGSLTPFMAPRIDTPASHGTGCTLSAAITARLALGDSLANAIQNAKTYLNQTLLHSFSWNETHALNQGTTHFPATLTH